MTDRDEASTEALRGAIRHRHGCDSRWVESVDVHEKLDGRPSGRAPSRCSISWATRRRSGPMRGPTRRGESGASSQCLGSGLSWTPGRQSRRRSWWRSGRSDLLTQRTAGCTFHGLPVTSVNSPVPPCSATRSPPKGGLLRYYGTGAVRVRRIPDIGPGHRTRTSDPDIGPGHRTRTSDPDIGPGRRTRTSKQPCQSARAVAPRHAPGRVCGAFATTVLKMRGLVGLSQRRGSCFAM